MSLPTDPKTIDKVLAHEAEAFLAQAKRNLSVAKTLGEIHESLEDIMSQANDALASIEDSLVPDIWPCTCPLISKSTRCRKCKPLHGALSFIEREAPDHG